MTQMEETTPLLASNTAVASNDVEAQIQRKKKINIIYGVVYGLLSAFVFAFYLLGSHNYFKNQFCLG